MHYLFILVHFSKELEIASTLGITHQDVYSDEVSFTYEVIERSGRRVRVVPI